MKKISPIKFILLRKTLNPSILNFTSTAELKTLTEFLGQKRALEAVHFGTGIKGQGYNIFAMGPAGIGKKSLIRTVISQKARKQAVPPDWCYIYNFDYPEKPIAIQLPAGLGNLIQQDLKFFLSEASKNIIAIFESDEYQNGMLEITKEFDKKRRQISKNANTKKYSKTPRLFKEKHDKENKLQTKLTTAVIQPLINQIKNKYSTNACLQKYLTNIQNDFILNVNDFLKRDDTTGVWYFPLDNPLLIRYQINLITNNEKRTGAPVIFEENPTYSNLICRVEHMSQAGGLVTNFTLIKPGSLHQANGGYLIIEARKLKKNKDAWEALKRALFTNKIIIEPIEHSPENVKPISIEPMPIPLDIKIVLLGERSIYYYFFNHDSDFNELFKVIVDFDEQIPRNKKNINLYARLIATIARREKLRPFNANAIAAIIDYSSRLAEDNEKLSTHIRSIDDIIVEADYWASLNQDKIVERKHVTYAINAHRHRLDRTQELYYEEIYRKFILINTKGKIIGQVNCLSVVRVGKLYFGHPSRVTSIVRMGKGTVIDIQREIRMAGASHAKASLIIANFIRGRYYRDFSFSLFASLSFEQIYGHIDGDSASLGEVCAILSALAETPINQRIAITGSMDQYGHAQAVGKINEKIEGFFDVCKLQGFRDQHGVIIPKVNMKNLMLREDIVIAAKHKKFLIYAINTLDEALYILTGLPAGSRQKNGFTPDSLNAKVEAKLKLYHRNQMALRQKKISSK